MTSWSGALAISAVLLASGCSAPATGGSAPATGSAAAAAAAAVESDGAPAEGDDVATVIRVVDGDTFDADLHGKRTRIRLLNVDTPETKHPNKTVQCQGPEATRALTDLLPVGSTVSLGYDVERTDHYGRTLAGVTGPTGVFVNAELARLGLGVAVVFQPNVKWYDTVKKAQDEASQTKRGLFDPSIGCTIPAAQQALSTAVSGAGAEESAAAATATANELTAQIAQLEAIRSLLRKPPTAFVAASAFSASDLGSLIDRAEDARTTAVSTASTWKAKDDARQRETSRAAEAQRQQEAAQAAAARQAEAERQTAAANAAAEAQARQAAEAQAAAEARARAQEAAQAQEAAAEAARQAQEQQGVAPAPAPEPPSSNPYPGYNGPRCYEPGGRVWHPCG